jgi:hypothetical protein
VGVDAYVDPDDPGFRPAVQEFRRHGKPLAVTEFGVGAGRSIYERDRE